MSATPSRPVAAPRFVMRRPGTELTEVVIGRAAASMAPEALSHVASSVFEDEHDERHHLRDAAAAMRAALGTQEGKRLRIGFSADELRHMPEALRHVAHEIFRDTVNETLLRDIADAAEAAAPSPGPRR